MPKIELTITHDTDTGQIELNGPLDNELYVYGLLKKAEQATHDHNRKPKSPIVMPKMGIPRE